MRIVPLQPPDSFHLRAAEGWLELGNRVEAEADLQKIASHLRDHPEVLKVRWQIHAAASNWDSALEVATALVQNHPGEPLGWTYRSSALYHLNRTAEARDSLATVVRKFPGNVPVRFNLACYECQLGNLGAAGDYLSEAFRLAKSRELMVRAFEHPDLKPLWREHGITELGQVCAKPIDLSAKAGRATTTFLLSILFWALATAGVAWREGAKSRADVCFPGLSAAGTLLFVSILFLMMSGPMTIEAWLFKRPEFLTSPVSAVGRFGMALLLASITGAVLSLCCFL